MLLGKVGAGKVGGGRTIGQQGSGSAGGGPEVPGPSGVAGAELGPGGVRVVRIIGSCCSIEIDPRVLHPFHPSNRVGCLPNIQTVDGRVLSD